MTTEKDINLAIQKEYDAFNSATYAGEPSLPKDLLERFRTAIYKSSPASHKIPMKVVEKILAKKVKELTNFEVPTILNVITQIPLCDLYPTFDAAIKGNEQIEELKVSYNLLIMQINKQMEEKRQTMLKLISPSNGKLKLAEA